MEAVGSRRGSIGSGGAQCRRRWLAVDLPVAPGESPQMFESDVECHSGHRWRCGLGLREATVCLGERPGSEEACGRCVELRSECLAESAFGDVSRQAELGDRGKSRNRLGVVPAVPFSVRVLMVLVSAVSLAAIAAFTLPYISRGVQIGASVVMAVVFMAMHWTIYEIDHKFDGVIQVEPAEMQLLSTAMSEDFTERHADVMIPCDEEGRPR